LILLNLGLDLEVIPKGLFSVLVGSAMIRNLLVTPVLRRVTIGSGEAKTSDNRIRQA